MALAFSSQRLFMRIFCRRAHFSAIQGNLLDVQKTKSPPSCCRQSSVLSSSQQNFLTTPADLQRRTKQNTRHTQIKSLNYSPTCNLYVNKYRNISNSLQQNLHKSSFSASSNTLGRNKKSLLQVCDKNHHSHNAMSSLSPAQLILESCPAKVQPYLRLIRFEKPIGTWLLYWPCTWSIALAASPGHWPDMKLLCLFGAGAFFMRGAGCIINDLWDKDFDSKVERTKKRPIASGELSSFQAFAFLGSQLSCALAILLQLNWYSVFLGAASMGLVIVYPLAKRYTYWPQLVLGFTFNYGALLGWAAVQGSNDWAVCLPLYMSCLLWTLVYDTIYAHQDKYDDMLIGVKSTALKFGDQTKPWLFGFTALMCGGLTSVGMLGDMTWPYYLAVILTCGRLAHQITSVNLNSAEDCAQTFRGNFYLGVVMFTGIVMANLLKSNKQTDDQQEFLHAAS